MPDVISMDDLRALAAGGARVNREPREVVVGGLDSIIVQLKAIAEKRDNEMLRAIEGLAAALVEKGEGREPMDMAPLIAAIAARSTKCRPTYRFEIERNDRGLISAVTATPSEGDNG